MLNIYIIKSLNYYCPGVKRSEREPNHSPLSSAEVMNALTMPSVSHTSS